MVSLEEGRGGEWEGNGRGGLTLSSNKEGWMRRRKERKREMVEDWVFIGWEICRISRFGRVDRDRQPPAAQV
jgi:hypothetical protein